MQRRVLLLVAVVVLAGCSLPGSVGEGGGGPDGVEDGMAVDADLSVSYDDGLNESELRAVKSRMMARIEAIRGLQFRKDVPVTVLTRAEYRERVRDGTTPEPKPWREQFWEATFIVDEDTTVFEARRTVYGSTVQGFYNGSHIVLITGGSGPVSIDRGTLVHELTHALQSQHFSLSTADATYDGRLAETAIVEGDANYVEDVYRRRCATEWECMPTPAGGGGGGGDINFGLFVSIFLPYSDGPTFVEHLREAGGWERVNDAFEQRPASTEQVIHPEKYPDDPPERVSIPDRSDDDWHRFRTEDGYRRDRIGEATLFAMLWYNGVVPREKLFEEGSRLSAYDYSHPATAGWEGDAIVPYTNGSSYGYVFKSTWETERDARQFHEAYLKVLMQNGAVEVREGVYRIPDGGYADAFRVVRHGDTVIVVNAPTVAALDDVHAPNGTATTGEGAPAPALPGFGAAAALVALGAIVLALRRRS